MKILVIGNGGREHAIVTKISQSNLVTEIWVAPGNAGMFETVKGLHKADISATDVEALVGLARIENIDLTIVGPESSLEKGIVDAFKKRNLLIVGPTQYASQLESSKAFCKEVMMKANLPTAKYQEFFDAESAIKYIKEQTKEDLVVKCDGLAAGKGVVVCKNHEEAIKAVTDFMVNDILGFKVEHLLIEECFYGKELSAFALCDGNDFVFLGTACDHKRLRDHDQGPNTGGMGVISPAFMANADYVTYIEEKIFRPMVNQMKKINHPFTGILFAGLIDTIPNDPGGIQVLEFNVRFGDPETQGLLPLIDEDLVPYFLSAAKGELKHGKLKLKNKKAVHVVLASHGYPGTEGIAIRTNDDIQVDSKFDMENNFLFYAGVKKENGKLKTSGGRVLGLTILRDSFQDARIEVYERLKKVQFKDMQYRTDIGLGL